MTVRRPSKPPYHFAHPLLRARDWQHRPELDHLRDWWRDGGRGVCGLVGIGGAGKTASVDRFLRLLPGVLPEDGFDRDPSLAKPQRLFVFSFYDEANPDAFFAQLAAWLSDPLPREKERQPSYEQVLRLLESAGTCLLVLDGLEKVQDDGLRGRTFGELLDNRLRSLLLRIAEGRVGSVSVIVTTRFVLHDLHDRAGIDYLAIPIDRIAKETCVNLLRRRGVNGSDTALLRIAEDCGCHALTVDLAGGYIAVFGGGDPARAIDLALGPDADPPAGTDSGSALEVSRQTARFERVAQRYREALARTDPAALALLERVCLFRMGVDAEILALIFTGEDKEAISGPHLAALSLDDVRRRLDRLVDLRLLEATRRTPRSDRRRHDQVLIRPTLFSGRRGTTYSIHPAVRDGFRSHLDARSARLSHEAARLGLIASLGGLPGRDANPSDTETLDLLEEVVYHTLESGQVGTAWDIHTQVIGGYQNLGWRLGAYERGERLCRAFVSGRAPESAPLPERMREGEQARFINEWALYLSDLGRLDAAARCLERNIALRMQQQSWKNASIGNQNLCDLLVQQGNLARARVVAEEALLLADRAHAAEHKDCFAHLGHVLGLLGETEEALRAFERALMHQRCDDGDSAPLYRLRGVQHAWLLVRLGRLDEAKRALEVNRGIVRHLYGDQSHHVPRCDLLLSAIDRCRGNYATARLRQTQAHEWATARDAREILCWSFWERAGIELADPTPRTDRLSAARDNIEEGLWLARDCGFGLFHIDLLLLRSWLGLLEGDAERAEEEARTALEVGHCPPLTSGQPSLPAITDPRCGYLWGAALARRLLGEAVLLRASRRPDPALVEEGRLWLEACAATRRRIGDPAEAKTEARLEELKRGVLTHYRSRERS